MESVPNCQKRILELSFLANKNKFKVLKLGATAKESIVEIDGHKYDANFEERKKYLYALELLVNHRYLESLGDEEYELTYKGLLAAEDPQWPFE